MPRHPREPRQRRRALLAFLPAAIAVACLNVSAPASADAYPSKPVTMIVPFPAGGPTDSQIRALSQAAARILGQSIVVENRPGVSGTLGPASMARTAGRDGYTLAMITPALFRLPHLQPVSYDAMNDFTYVVGLTSYVQGVSVAADSRWKTMGEFIDHARANPGKVSVASVGNGSLGHITVARLSRAAGIKLNFVPFKGGSEATVALLGGHVDAMIEAGWGAMAESGKLRLLAVVESERLKRWPGVPTLRELGYDITVQSEIGIAGPRGLDPKVVATLQDAFRKASTDPAYQRALDLESMPNRFMGTAEYQKYAADQFASDKRNIAELNLTLN
jgi:tripartite-type tricarboxylate transporter receptor subunit TctC